MKALRRGLQGNAVNLCHRMEVEREEEKEMVVVVVELGATMVEKKGEAIGGNGGVRKEGKRGIEGVWEL